MADDLPSDLEVLQLLVEEMTLSGCPVLDDSKIRRTKKICKKSNENVKILYKLVTKQLAKEHSEIRLSAFQIIDEIFRRSHSFRSLLVNNLKSFIQLVFEVEPSRPLPPPKEAAANLKVKAIVAMDQWHEKFGHAYKRLSLAYHYLNNCHKVDFRNVTDQNRIAVELAKMKEERRREQRRERLERTREQIASSRAEIESSLTELENACSILIPDVNDLCEEFSFEREDFQASEMDTENERYRSHGIGVGYSLELNLDTATKNVVKESEDNRDLVRKMDEIARDLKRKKINRLKGWLKSLTQNDGLQAEIVELVNLKERLSKSVSKYEQLNIERKEEIVYDEEDDDDDDDFEEVQDATDKEGYEPVIPPHKRKEYGLETATSGADKRPTVNNNIKRLVSHGPKKRKLEAESDPTDRQATIKKMKESGEWRRMLKMSGPSKDSDVPGTSAASNASIRAASNAPVIPYDKDLYYLFENPSASPPSIDRLESLHRFWTPRPDDSIDSALPKTLEAGLKMRQMSFAGKFVPVKHKCNVALPNGKLCPRMDRVKCPFHGVIVPRDAKGLPLDERLREEEAAKAERLVEGSQKGDEGEAETRPWLDAELLRDIEAQTGRDLGSKFVERKMNKGKKEKGKGKGKGKKSKPESNVTNIKANRDTVRSRLDKKLFNRSTMKRVNNVLNSLEKQKVFDKFGDNFNYVHGP